jgi:hypothetical protein
MEKSEEKEQVMAQMLQSGDVLPAVVEALWSATLIDIDSTLSNVCVNLTQACVNLTQACVYLTQACVNLPQVCRRVLHDSSLGSKELSIKRAAGMKVLGRVFQETTGGAEKTDVRALMEAAMMRAVGVNPDGTRTNAEDDESS